MDREQGRGSCPQDAPELASDKRLKVRLVVEITRVSLEEFRSGFMKTDFITSALLDTGYFLVGDGWNNLRICSSNGWTSEL